MKTVTILEACDGFTLVVKDSENPSPDAFGWYNFNQEDSVEGLVQVFKRLGIEASYEEDY